MDIHSAGICHIDSQGCHKMVGLNSLVTV